MPRCPTSTASRLRARVALLALLTAGLAGADSRIDVPEGCGSELEWRAELERLTPASAASLEVRLQIARLGPSDFELRLSVGDERRVLRDPVCRVLWRSALVIAAAASRPEPASAPPPAPDAPAPTAAPSSATATPPSVEPLRARPSAAPTATPRSPPGPAGPASAAPATGRSVPRRNASARRPPREAPAPVARSREVRREPGTSERAASGGDVVRLGASLTLGVSSGVVPGWGPAFGASLQLEKRPWALALGLQHWPERGQTLDSRSVLVTATGGRATALFRVAPALDLWAGLELNRLIGEGSANVQGPASDVAWQLAPLLGANLITMNIGYLRLELGALARLSLLRPRFEVTGFGTLYRAPPLAADAIIRGVLLFW